MQSLLHAGDLGVPVGQSCILCEYAEDSCELIIWIEFPGLLAYFRAKGDSMQHLI